jgi:hypothetical protein
MALNKLTLFFCGAFSISRTIVKRIAYHKHSLFLPDVPQHDDHYVVSFPKSGATWVDFLMANIHIEMSGEKKMVNFYNIHTIIPDIHYCKHLGVSKLKFPGFRVIKSHADFNPYYKNVVYVLRDPRDVLVSYHKFLRGLGQFSGTISDLIRSPRYGITAWVSHVNSWYSKTDASLRIIFLRYEDLKIDSHSTLKHLYATLGFDVPDDILVRAINKSSFESMRQSERIWNYGGRPIADNFRFMQKGTSGGWEYIFSDADREHIWRVGGDLLHKFGYIE